MPQGSFAFGTTWKVLVFMQADNDLAPYAFWDLAEMEKASSPILPVFVELDLPGNGGITRLKVANNTSRGELQNIDYSNWSLDNLSSQVIDQLFETQYNQATRLLNFIQESEKNYPTDHTMLVIWGHGEGFTQDHLAQFGGVAIDEFPFHDKLSLDQIKNILAVYKNVFQKKIDVLAMDACLMQTLEVALELQSGVNYLIGSTQIQDFRGLPYDDVLNFMQEDVSPYELAIKIPALFEKRARENFDYDKRTMSSINVNELVYEFIPAFTKVVEMMNNYIEENPFHKLDLLRKLQELPFFLGESRDLSTLLSHLEEFFIQKEYFDISEMLSLAQKKIHKANIAYYYGNYYIYENRFHLGAFKAFGVWMPGSVKDYQQRKNLFSHSEIYKIIPNWKPFLDKLYSEHL